jgi:hypothetical protein
MPESEQIGYSVTITPSDGQPNPASYVANFIVEPEDLKLAESPDGIRRGTLVVGLTVYDRYGQAINQQARRASITIKPENWEAIKTGGLSIAAKFEAPAAGQYWLRTGIYDEGGSTIGTLEIPLSQVKTEASLSKN